jgi:hypothetical protein
MDRVYELPLSRDYVRHWGLLEAIREIMQNALDSKDPIEWSIEGHTLTVTSRTTVLPSSTLVLGQTSKADDVSKIGSFGEGFKLALLVLARLNYDVKLYNGDLLWTPAFGRSDTFECEVLQINESLLAHGEARGLSFVIDGLNHEDTTQIHDMCLFMQATSDDVIVTKFGDILPSKPGFLYVGGLLVCETQLSYGYNVLPQYLELERDRQTVDDWDLRRVTKDMWLNTEQWERVAELMDQDIEDVKYIEYDCPQLVKEACYKRFKQNNPGKVAVRSQAEMEKYVEKGMTKTVHVGGSYYTAVTGHAAYKTENAKVLKVQTPLEILTEWFRTNQAQMRLPVRIAYKQLLKAAEKWAIK